MSRGKQATWAHSANHLGRRHLLRDHLLGTAALAKSFGAGFGAADLTEALGLLHDAGKASCGWQDGLIRAETLGGRVGLDHKTLGVRLLKSVCGPGVAAILGHHGGLLDFSGVRASLVPGPDDDEVRARLVGAVPEAGELLARGGVLWPSAWSDPETTELGLRLAFSCLVDADFLDTAAHFAGQPSPAVSAPADMAGLIRRFESRRADLLTARLSSPIDELRQSVYRASVSAAARRPGVFRLSAPTGSGKTLAAAGFALHHAARHRKSRVIVAVPFITITEQNAAVFRRLLGDDVVVEHHSSVDPDVRDAKLAVENWDAPFIITTTVQLFDSLFGRRPARSRKVHRLANAVIVLDEVQALPTALLPAILSGLRTLTRQFGATVLLVSATQPSFQVLGAWRSIAPEITEITEDPVTLYRALRRVEYHWWLDPRPTLDAVADAAAGRRQSLVVVNTVADARTVARRVARRTPAAALHLSTRMCPVHRRAVLEEARARLAGDRPVVLVATQLIEAGVDVDFPVVYRALAPADSLQQAAGRANREGRRAEPGLVIVFDATDSGCPPAYRTPVAKTRQHFGPGAADPDDLDALGRYYPMLYDALNVDKGRRASEIASNRRGLRFEAVADGPLDAFTGRRDPSLSFRMLDDDGVAAVVGGFGDAERVSRLLTEVRAATATTRVFRQLQAHTVSLPRRVAARPDVAALLSPVVDGLWEWVGDYDDLVGIDDAATTVETVW